MHIWFHSVGSHSVHCLLRYGILKWGLMVADGCKSILGPVKLYGS